MPARRHRMAVVGHVEWVEFVHVPHVPAAGEVIHGENPFEEPAGGGAVAAVQLARLAGNAELITALGRDDHGERSIARLGELGVRVRCERLAAPTRRAVTFVDEAGERTITTLGPRLEPRGVADEEGWDALANVDGLYFTAGDIRALHRARAASRVLVASPRAAGALGHRVPLDALVLSGEDRGELHAAAGVERDAALVVRTEGGHGGSYRLRSGEEGRWEAAALPGEVADSYGCGDSFAAGLTYALGAGLEVPDALSLAARCGAFCLTGRGPYGRQLRCEDL